MTWDVVTGPLAALAVGALLGAYVVGVVRRERRGPEPFTATLAASRPVGTMVLVVLVLTAALLVIVRLGVLS